jgi:Ca2+-binding RTX toxin-like protein
MVWTYTTTQRSANAFNLTPQANWSDPNAVFSDISILAQNDGSVIVAGNRGGLGVRVSFAITPEQSATQSDQPETFTFPFAQPYLQGAVSQMTLAGRFGDSLNMIGWQRTNAFGTAVVSLPHSGDERLYLDPVSFPGSAGPNQAFNPDLARLDAYRLFQMAYEIRPLPTEGAGAQGIALFAHEVNGPTSAEHFINDLNRIESDPSITHLPTIAGGKGYAVAYSSSDLASMASQLWVARFDGATQLSNTLVDAAGTINDQAETVTLSDGGFVVVYRDNGWAIDGTEITALIFNADGTQRGTYILVNGSDTARNQEDPQIAALPDGHFVVAWTIALAGNAPRVTWQVFDSLGNAVGDRRYMADNTDQPSITAFSDGRFMVAFRNITAGNTDNIRSVIDEVRRSMDGTNAGETINGSGLAETINGLDGADTINGLGGTDVIDGGAGNDTIDSGASNDTIYGGTGKDIINGGAGMDRLFGGEDDDVITGGETTNIIDGGGGNDIIIPWMLNATGFEDYTSGTRSEIRGGEGINLYRGINGYTDFIGGSGSDTVEFLAGAFVRYDVTFDPVTGQEFYTAVFSGITVDLAAGTGSAGWAESDTFTEIEHITGTFAADTILGDGKANILKGLEASDLLEGRGGADTLDGGTGIDIMRGGFGSDIYHVDVAGDVTDETGGDGLDTILSSASRTLSAGIERLFLLGTANINAAGRAGQADYLVGNAGNNILNGLTGADYMRGGLGNDTYYVDHAGDLADEVTGGGGAIDTVLSSVSSTLSAGIERLFLLGTANINAAGRAGQADYLVGNAGNNTLNGLTGADYMRGALGNDTYYVDHASDLTDEVTGGGGMLDTVYSSVSFSAAAGIERLFLTGTGAFNATGRNAQNDFLVGNGAANVIVGLSGADVLAGGLGNDTLTGGADADRFRFFTTLNSATNVDRVTDFVSGSEKIELYSAIFGSITNGGAGVQAGEFRLGTAAADSNDYLIYNQATGELFYDANGSGAGGQTLFARLNPGAALAFGDFVMV